jgi:hypothetical protein
VREERLLAELLGRYPQARREAMVRGKSDHPLVLEERRCEQRALVDGRAHDRQVDRPAQEGCQRFARGLQCDSHVDMRSVARKLRDDSWQPAVRGERLDDDAKHDTLPLSGPVKVALHARKLGEKRP